MCSYVLTPMTVKYVKKLSTNFIQIPRYYFTSKNFRKEMSLPPEMFVCLSFLIIDVWKLKVRVRLRLFVFFLNLTLKAGFVKISEFIRNIKRVTQTVREFYKPSFLP